MTTSTINTLTSDRSKLETTGITGAAANAVGIFLVVAGRIGGWKGFTPDDNDTSTLGGIAVALVLLGYVLTIGTVIALVIRQRRDGLSVTTRVLLGWLGLAVAITALFGAGLFGS